MASWDEFLQGLLTALGPTGSLLILFVIFAADAAVFPALPEVWTVVTYAYRPSSFDPLSWALLILGMAMAGEAVGNLALYLVVRRVVVRHGRMPSVLERAMRKWVDFLVVHDERIILVNRVAPVVPFVGAFIATLGWNVRTSLLYILVGAAVKYSALLALVGVVGIAYNTATARSVSLLLVVLTIFVSAGASLAYRRTLRRPRP